ncbi:uncharacterized protein LOC142322873 [Lycorma delicatula]|uniref:uncharacterized protein LOC142322873 n=1 Tax=Lycorma delicatula TaxID=130591 RepID=UPI003F50E09A
MKCCIRLGSEESYMSNIFLRKEDKEVIERNNQVYADKVEILFRCETKYFEDEDSEVGSCIFYDVSEPNIVKDSDSSGCEEYYDVEDSEYFENCEFNVDKERTGNNESDISESVVHRLHIDNEVGSNTNENNSRSINNEVDDESNSVNEVIISEAAKLTSKSAEDCGKNICEEDNID